MQGKKPTEKKKYIRKKNHHLISAGAGIVTLNGKSKGSLTCELIDSKRSSSYHRSQSRELIDPSYLVEQDKHPKNTSDMISDNESNVVLESSVPISKN